MLSDVRLQRFRSYRDDSFEFDNGVNIIVGPNASGKTNLLEALLVSCQGSSYRVKDSELVAFGAQWGRIDAREAEGLRTVKLIVGDDGRVRKEFEIQNQKFHRLSLQKTKPVVLFEPNHLLLLHGSPDSRREYVDGILTQILPGYTKTRREYQRVLAQRNALLKRGVNIQDQLFAWNVRLSEVGASVATARTDLIQRINENIGQLYQKISNTNGSEVSIRYVPVCDVAEYSSALLRALERRQDVDIERGFTTVGPHREDVQVEINARVVGEVASRGEIRSIILALKIIELQFIEEARGTKPLLLLDDVFSELDGARRKALTEVISGYQSFITTTDADVVVQHFMDNCTIIPLG